MPSNVTFDSTISRIKSHNVFNDNLERPQLPVDPSDPLISVSSVERIENNHPTEFKRLLSLIIKTLIFEYLPIRSLISVQRPSNEIKSWPFIKAHSYVIPI